jgi:multidrug efflux system membrane fusion protein
MDAAERAPLALRVIGRIVGVLIVAGAVAASIYAYRLNFRNPRTDDAAVRANIVGIAPHVSGPIVDLTVVDNQHVKEGDLLFTIDCRPYEARLARTRADLALALKEVDAQHQAIAAATTEVARRQASLAAATADLARRETQPPLADAEIARAEEEQAAAEAAVVRLEAEAAYAEDYLRRVEPLLARLFVTADRVSDAPPAATPAPRPCRRHGVACARPRPRCVRRARASPRPRRPSISVAARQEAGHAIAQSTTTSARPRPPGPVRRSQRACRPRRPPCARPSSTSGIAGSAPFDAYVTNLNIAVGEYARQGQQVFALVDSRAWYVLANFRETYMASIRPGMQAEVYLLAYPGRPFRGVVQGIGWANHPEDGATVGVLPDVRKTLNWVRLASRFPVRILLEDRDAERPFRMGTTAVVTIRGFPGRVAPGAPAR